MGSLSLLLCLLAQVLSSSSREEGRTLPWFKGSWQSPGATTAVQILL